ncbi:hypothetical protein C7448_102496 [Tenacibaculum gallaicum]|uniref:Lipoprotein n=1 Tax=Tenacibaculum gallaicum TaxID=561505 RepID=A0A3E0I888_9FLAO|nr:hypothetical protein [Tenacibaculum gallaicum]REH54963.1 hypothetical protein C7448_102496 [Tenacibaculum gallaicum]
MNKIVLILTCYLLIGCEVSKKTIELSQSSTEYPVIIRLSKKFKKVISIKLPLKVDLINNSNKDEEFIKIKYNYNSIPIGRDYGIMLFEYKEKSISRTSNNSKKEVLSYNNKEYLIYSRHFVDSTKSIQQQFKPYVAKMLAENKDTLHIGRVTEFKKNHAALFKKLTKGDSISIQFLDDGKFGERVTVPVEW